MARIIPHQTKFFEMFAEQSSNLVEGAKVLRELLEKWNDVPSMIQRIKGIEHKGDDIAHAIFIKLNQTFITPFDREDIHLLASSIDDVLDFINSAADRIGTYKIDSPPPGSAQLAMIIQRQAEELAKAVGLLEHGNKLLDHCVEVNRLENEADTVSRGAIGWLFENEKAPIQLIKHKEVIEVLEAATDRAEDAANVLETVVLKST
jgi:predicted phosphate transport protein (TIGR00153 family)